MIKVIENCISNKDQDFLENIIGSINFEWHYLEKSNYNGVVTDPKLTKLFNMKGYSDYPTLSNKLYDGTGTGVDMIGDILQILGPVFSAQVQLPKSIYLESMRINMLYPLRDYPTNAVGCPHVDNPNFGDNMYTALYYVNDSDGDTVLYNETYDQDFPDVLTESTRVTPEKGKLVIFNRNQLHSASLPSYGRRMVININYYAS